MRKLYLSYFMELVNNKANLKIAPNDYNEIIEQIERYGEFEDIKNIKGLSKYTIVVVNDTVYVEKI